MVDRDRVATLSGNQIQLRYIKIDQLKRVYRFECSYYLRINLLNRRLFVWLRLHEALNNRRFLAETFGSIMRNDCLGNDSFLSQHSIIVAHRNADRCVKVHRPFVQSREKEGENEWREREKRRRQFPVSLNERSLVSASLSLSSPLLHSNIWQTTFPIISYTLSLVLTFRPALEFLEPVSRISSEN